MAYSPLTEQPNEKDVNVVMGSTSSFSIRIEPFTAETLFQATAKSYTTGIYIPLPVAQEGLNNGYVRIDISDLSSREPVGYGWQLQQRETESDDWTVAARGKLRTTGFSYEGI